MSTKLKAEEIARWAENHSLRHAKESEPCDGSQSAAPGKKRKHLTGNEVADVLRWHAQGLTQEHIAAKFEPPKDQSTISRTLARYGIDNTAEAKRILRGGAASMALNIVKNGQPKDHAVALKGLGVLEEQQSQGITVIVGGGGKVLIAPGAVELAPTEVIDSPVLNPDRS